MNKLEKDKLQQNKKLNEIENELLKLEKHKESQISQMTK